MTTSCCKMQCSVQCSRLPLFQIAAVGQEQLTHLSVTSLSSNQQRCDTIWCCLFHIGFAGFQQQFANISVASFERRPSEPPHGAGRLHRNAVLSSCDLEKDYLQWPVITKMKCRNFNPHVWRFPGCWQRRDEISLFKSKLATSSPFASNLGLGFLPRSRPKMKTGKRGKNLPVESIETDGGELNF